MDPNNNQNPSQSPQSPIPDGAYIPPPPPPDQANLAPAGQPPVPGLSPIPATQQPSIPLPQQPGQPGQPVAQPQPQAVPLPDVPTTTNNGLAGMIDDGDLIEKEWVHKAKSIVDRNRDDPFRQSEELTEVKAEYMKQRYDKDIKLDK